jgi:hypothetical protein
VDSGCIADQATNVDLTNLETLAGQRGDRGDYQLAKTAGNYYQSIVDSNAEPIRLTVGLDGGSFKTALSGGWNATQVEPDTAGFRVLLHNWVSGKFWESSFGTDGKLGDGEMPSSGSALSSFDVAVAEGFYQTDLDGDNIIPTLVKGTDGDDVLMGTDEDDVLLGYGGNDVLNGKTGNDLLSGGTGNDWLSGGDVNSGDDQLNGGDGDDRLYGRDGDDQLDGGTGKDIITTGSGSDTIYLRIGDGSQIPGGADIITDFLDDVDNFGLVGGLLFDDLDIIQGDGPYAGDTIIKYNGEILAIVQVVDSLLFSSRDFVAIEEI